jgi:hypothetical protein
MNRKDTEQAIRAELSRYPNIRYTLERGTKHPRVVIRCGERSRKVTYSGTPTEPRAILNKLTDIRHAVREVTGA